MSVLHVIFLLFLAPAVMAGRDPIRRQSQPTKPDSSSYYTLSTTATGDSQCLFPIPGVDGSVPYPVRFSPCGSLQDEKSWQFVPDGAGLYFVYNKAWPGTSSRLDINCPQPTLCIMWMGPSDPKYFNQHWSLQSDGADSVMITSRGLPGWFLTSGTADGSTVAFLQNDTTASLGDEMAWKLNIVATSVVSTTEAEKSTVKPPATTPPASSPETKADTSASTTFSTITSASTSSSRASSRGQSEGTTTSQTNSPAPSSTHASTSAPINPKEGGDEKQEGMSEGMKGIIAGSVVGVATFILMIVIWCVKPATAMKVLTCGLCYRKRKNKEMKRAIRKSAIRLIPWNDGRGAGKVDPGESS